MIALQRSNLAIRKGLTFGHAHPCLDAFITFTTDLQQDRHRWMQITTVKLQNGSRKNAMFISYLTYLWYYNLFAWVNSVMFLRWPSCYAAVYGSNHLWCFTWTHDAEPSVLVTQCDARWLTSRHSPAQCLLSSLLRHTNIRVSDLKCFKETLKIPKIF